jgi:general secretion pathway protein E
MDAVGERHPAIESDTPLTADMICRRFVERIPIAFARRFGALGLVHENGCMRVALASPDAMHALDKIATMLGVPTTPVMVDEAVITRLINEAYGERDSGVDTVIEDIAGAQRVEILDGLAPGGDLLDNSGSSPVTKLVNLVLLEAVKRRASDVHVQPLEDRLQVRLRIDGVLYDYVQPPRHLLDEIVSRIKVMGRMNIAEKRLAQDGRTTVMVGDRVVDLRISSLPTSFGERVVLRLLDKSARLYRLPELGMCDGDLVTFDGLIRQSHGIILVTGPTGSGKSTTLYAALQELDAGALNILTLEDPIEYQLDGISQTQVSAKKGMTFATGLRTVLRQDPDVIMVGEIRDEETARMAIQSSLTGHLVLSTLHTNDAAGAVARLIDLGVEPYLVAGSLLGVLAQRLVRRVCERCAGEQPLHAQDMEALHLDGTADDATIRHPVGCAECLHTGYRDRRGIFELLRMDDALRTLICGRPGSGSIKQAARRAGMTTLREDAVRKLMLGVTTVEEVLRVTHAD